jgi:catechol 2,3-dioxygenase-like lactoylglutathione lyase family enzyme
VINTHGLTHISLSVADPERSLAFYERLFGVREYHREEGSIQVKGPGPNDILVFERRANHGEA